MRVNPGPAVWPMFPVSPPNWNMRSLLELVDTPVLHGELPGHAMFAWAVGRDGFGSKGLARLAPETAKATSPNHVSPLAVV